MTESTESAERLARPLIHLARLVGLATSYIGMSDDYHEIDDDVLKALLGALGVDAHDDDAIDDSVVRILRERHGRLVAPTVLHVVGKEDRVLLNTGIMQIPSATITLETATNTRVRWSREPETDRRRTRSTASSWRRHPSPYPRICRWDTIRCMSAWATARRTPR